MHRLTAALVLALAAAGAVAQTDTAPVVVAAQSVDAAAKGPAPDAIVEQTIEDAAAAAVIGALGTRFEGRDVQFRLGDMDTKRASLRDLALAGEGQVRLDSQSGWLPLRFEALYDTDTQTVLSPSITLGGDQVAIAPPKLPLDGLREEVGTAMSEEFASQQVKVVVADARVVGNDGHRLVVEADGVASFDGADRAPVTIQAIYDANSRAWSDAQYAFADVAN